MGLPFENADYYEDRIGATKIPELTDVSLTNLANNEILVYNSSSEVWENKAQSSGINELNDISGVTITNVQANQVLKYINGVWVNSTDTNTNTDNLNDLTDTLLTIPLGNNEVLKYNSSSSKWENGNLNLNNINDVNITSLQNGEVLKYNSSTSKWENSNRIDTLNELTDVNIGTNLNNQVLKFNNSTGVYENQFVNLTELADTNITTLVNNNILIYKTASQKWEPGNISYTETDPIFTASPANGITSTLIGEWNSAYGWGNHATPGYLTSYTETDPVFTASPANGITSTQVTNWNSAYGWGDHAAQNYIKNIAPLHVDIPNLRVGIGIVAPAEKLDVDSIIQITAPDANTRASLYFRHISTGGHDLAQITSITSGTNGGDLQFWTADNGTRIKKITINEKGAIGIGATPNYGIAGQFLKTDGSGSAVSWDTETDPVFTASPAGSITSTQVTNWNTAYGWGDHAAQGYLKQSNLIPGTGIQISGTYPNITIANSAPDQIVSFVNNVGIQISGTYPAFTLTNTYPPVFYFGGTGVTINASNQISIGQSVATSASPSFNQLTLGSAGVNQGILNLQDVTNIGTDTISQIKGIVDGNNGGQLEFHTKVLNGGSLTKRMVIKNNGATEIYSDGIGLSILSTDGALQQARIYHGSTGTQDLIIDTDAPAATTKGISFRTQAGVQRLRIGYFGELGFSPTNDIGLSGQILESRGAGNTPRWVNAPAATLAKEAFNMRFNNKFNSYGAGGHLIGGYNDSTIMAGTNANTGNGRYTATRAIWMNFMFVALQYNNTGGTNDMSQSIRHFNSAGTLLEECLGQTIPSHNDPLNVIQATLSMNVVMYLNAGDYVLGYLGSSRAFIAYSLGVNSHVVFSGHNVD